jgi:hypothetical protein
MPSAVIRAFTYDEPRNELTVAFASGRVYVYSLVPADTAAAFGAAFSKGAFFNDHIRDRYPFRKGARHGSSSLRDALKGSEDGG